MFMDKVDTLHARRYWSEVLFCTIMTLTSRSRTYKFRVQVFGLSFFKSLSLECVDRSSGYFAYW